MVVKQKIHAIGRRKSSVARIYLSEGTGQVTVNGKDLKQYFGATTVYWAVAVEPLEVVGVGSKFDVHANISGGGVTGQADALKLALARALCEHEERANPMSTDAEGEEIENLPWRALLKSRKLLTRNARVVERKKYGFRKARKKEQYSKR